ncbi:MAG TPA: hypothetical protein VK714_03690 [Myxococcota bacterium]|nr:hypothetical protein [Myxococcota bacterium]
MKLYHFTGVEYLEEIATAGLTRGEVPLGPMKTENAVWLTRDPDPDSQGWAGEGHVLTDLERELAAKLKGRPVPPGAFLADKRAVRLIIEVPAGDAKLVPWLTFARQRGVSGKWRRTLNRTGGGGQENWFLYLGTVPTKWIMVDMSYGRALEVLESRNTEEDEA